MQIVEESLLADDIRPSRGRRIHLRSDAGVAPVQHETCGPAIDGGGAIILAYDGESHLVGIEILGASRLLTTDAIAAAQLPG